MIEFSEVAIEEELDLKLEELLKDQHEIILFDDDYHTFDFVINSLINVCRHSPIQAEQCTFIVHHNGKCSVKKGEYEKLEPICTALLDRGLSAEIR